jgi:hypothetical protein
VISDSPSAWNGTHLDECGRTSTRVLGLSGTLQNKRQRVGFQHSSFPCVSPALLQKKTSFESPLAGGSTQRDAVRIPLRVASVTLAV